MNSRQAAEVMVVGIQILGRLAPRSLDFRLLQLWGNGTNHARRHLVLQVEDALECAINAICPQVCSGRGVDELSGNPHLAPCFANTAFKNVAHAQFATNLPNIDSATLVCKARIPCDDEETAKA